MCFWQDIRQWLHSTVHKSDKQYSSHCLGQTHSKKHPDRSFQSTEVSQLRLYSALYFSKVSWFTLFLLECSRCLVKITVLIISVSLSYDIKLNHWSTDSIGGHFRIIISHHYYSHSYSLWSHQPQSVSLCNIMLLYYTFIKWWQAIKN